MKLHLLLCALLCALPCTAHAATAESCISTSCHPTLAKVSHPHEPVKSGDCLSCHKRQGKEHPLKGGKTFILAAKGEELCKECHDAMGKKKVVHAPVRTGECLSCHKPHGAQERFLIDSGSNFSQLCQKCHDLNKFNQKYVHGPVAEGACTACHEPHESGQSELLKGRVRDLCLGCHDDYAEAMKSAKRVHPPVKEKECTACHNPHSSAFPFLLKEKMPEICLDCHKDIAKRMEGAKLVHKPMLDEKGCGNCHSTHYANEKGLLAGDEESLCLGCHGSDKVGNPPLRNIKMELSGDKSLHGPIRQKKCGGCHDPHASQFPKMLTGAYPSTFYAQYSEGSYDLCLKCHQSNMLRFRETSMYTKFRNGDLNLHFIHVSDKRKGRTCQACHETHASSGQKLIGKEGAKFGHWKVEARFTPTATGGSCAPGCHRPLQYDRVKPVDYGAEPTRGTQKQPGTPAASR